MYCKSVQSCNYAVLWIIYDLANWNLLTWGLSCVSCTNALFSYQFCIFKAFINLISLSFVASRISSTGVLFNETKKFADDSLKMAKDVYRDSLEIYTEVESIRTVAVDVTSSTAEINRIKEEVKFLRETM